MNHWTGRRRGSLVVFTIVLAPILGLLADHVMSAPPQPAPNIVVIVVDDMGWTDTSIGMDPGIPDSASDYYETPNIDRLAMDGMRFTDAYSAAPVCSPTRAALQTGRSPAQLQMTFGDTVVPALTTTILPSTWYNVSLTFDSSGNAVDGTGNLDGMASMVVNGGAPLTAAVTKTAQGDGLNRPIAIGQLAIPGTHLVYFYGDVYNPSVSLIPEPSSLALLGLGGLMLLRRRKA